MDIELGDFGPADPAVRELSGADQFNVQWTTNIVHQVQSLGVLAEDGSTITIKSPGGDVYQLHWMTEEDCRIALGNTAVVLRSRNPCSN